MSGMITAVSLNPAIDRTMTVPGFTAGATNRAASSRTDPGGKGINVARVVKRLGGPVQVLGFLGASNGALHTNHLAGLAIPAQFISVPGDTRVNIKVIEPGSHQLTEINDAGFAVSAAHLATLITQAETLLTGTAVLVLAGSLPAGVPADIYGELIAAANRAGVPAILDADGEALARALPARPALIKPNRAEAERLLGRHLETRADLVQAAQDLLAGGARTVVISSGGEGAMLASAAGAWWATPPAINPGSTVGAGDSMVAGLALALARGMAPDQALRLATAAGSATASLAGTQVCDAAGVAALLAGVSITAIA
ncbi:MAG: fructose-phosphate kinase [Firmicutes bacterium]|nr:fructose-phosphate kinase [Bacillota bacterium]